MERTAGTGRCLEGIFALRNRLVRRALHVRGFLQSLTSFPGLFLFKDQLNI